MQIPITDSTLVDVCLHLDYRIRSKIVGANRESERFMLTVNAEICATTDLDESVDGLSDAGAIIGEMQAYLIRVGNTVDEGAELFDILDATQETMDADEAIFDSAFTEFCPTIRKMFEDAYPHDDILLLHRLTIHPIARGQRVGLAVLHQAIEDWSSGCSLVVMKPFPLQFEAGARTSARWNQLELGKFPASKRAAFPHLRNYYVRLGFQRIGRSEYYAMCPKYKMPSVEDLDLPDTFRVPLDFVARR